MLLEEPVVTQQPPTGKAPDVAVNDDHNEEHAAVLGEGKSIYSYGHFLTHELIFSRVIDLCAKEHG